jgi:hypothetical protein
MYLGVKTNSTRLLAHLRKGLTIVTVALEIINNVCSLIGERPIASSTGSLGTIVRSAINTAIQTVADETRASSFEKLITFTATNNDYLVPIGVIPSSVSRIREVSIRTDAPNQLVVRLESQSLSLLPYYYSYTVIGDNLYLSPSIARPVVVYALSTDVPTLPSDDTVLPFSNSLLPAISHSAAAILCISYLDDANAASLQQRLASDLITRARNNKGVGRARTFNMGGAVV